MAEKIMKSFVEEAVRKHHHVAVELCDDLYAHPELPDQEFRSSQKIVDILRKAGYQVEYPYLGYPTGFCGVLDNGDGPRVAILTEYDALPGLGHACGHNVHGSMSVLAALAMTELKDKFKGKVYVFGTPAEEEDGAKVGMAARGSFNQMSLALMIHSWSGGKSLADMDVLSLRNYIIEFSGLSAHAVAGPWEGHSALACARKFLDLIDARRECFTPDIHVNGVITEGGSFPNILPDRAVVRLEIRTGSLARLDQMDEDIRKCAKGACIALDCDVKFTRGFEDFADMVRVPVLEGAVQQLFEELGQPYEQVPEARGSSDVGNVSYHCPTIQPQLSISDTFYALHTEQFREETVKPRSHEAIAVGAQLIAGLVYQTMTDDGFREAVYHSYTEQLEKKRGT